MEVQTPNPLPELRQGLASLPAYPLLEALIKNAKVNALDGIYDSSLSSHPNSALGVAELIDADGLHYILMRPTRIGDLNLDGQVTIADFLGLASHLNQPGGWQEGDMNGDGQVTIVDFLNLAANFRTSYSGEAFPIAPLDQQILNSFAESVPEPSSTMLSLLPLLSLLRRRRRHQ